MSFILSFIVLERMMNQKVSIITVHIEANRISDKRHTSRPRATSEVANSSDQRNLMLKRIGLV